MDHPYYRTAIVTKGLIDMLSDQNYQCSNESTDTLRSWQSL